jgi:hypothetical protein
MTTTSMRVDTFAPINPNETLVEFRGIGLKRDTPERRPVRQQSRQRAGHGCRVKTTAGGWSGLPVIRRNIRGQ